MDFSIKIRYVTFCLIETNEKGKKYCFILYTFNFCSSFQPISLSWLGSLQLTHDSEWINTKEETQAIGVADEKKIKFNIKHR